MSDTRFNKHEGNSQKIKITTSQALLLLLEKYRKSKDYNDDLVRLFFLGAVDKEAEKKIKKFVKEIEVEYEISNDGIEDPSRRYFETHLAFHTLSIAANNVTLSELNQHFASLQTLLLKKSDSPISLTILKDFLECNFDQLIENPNVDEGDKLNIKEYSDLYAKLNPEYAQKKTNYNLKKLENDKKTIKNKRQLQLLPTTKELEEQYALENSYFRDFTDEDKEKLALIALSSFLTILMNKDINDLPIDIYGQGFYDRKNRGQVKKLDQQYVCSHHLGLIKNFMGLSANDIAFSKIRFDYARVADRTNFDPASTWAKENFSYLVHPFSCSISGTMLLHLRVFSALFSQSLLTFNTQIKFENFIKAFVPLMIFNSGGHTFFEFLYPLRLKEVKESYHFLNTSEINMDNLFLQNNKKAFIAALDAAIIYNNEIIKRKSLMIQVENYINNKMIG